MTVALGQEARGAVDRLGDGVEWATGVSTCRTSVFLAVSYLSHLCLSGCVACRTSCFILRLQPSSQGVLKYACISLATLNIQSGGKEVFSVRYGCHLPRVAASGPVRGP